MLVGSCGRFLGNAVAILLACFDFSVCVCVCLKVASFWGGAENDGRISRNDFDSVFGFLYTRAHISNLFRFGVWMSVHSFWEGGSMGAFLEHVSIECLDFFTLLLGRWPLWAHLSNLFDLVYGFPDTYLAPGRGNYGRISRVYFDLGCLGFFTVILRRGELWAVFFEVFPIRCVDLFTHRFVGRNYGRVSRMRFDIVFGFLYSLFGEGVLDAFLVQRGERKVPLNGWCFSKVPGTAGGSGMAASCEARSRQAKGEIGIEA